MTPPPHPPHTLLAFRGLPTPHPRTLYHLPSTQWRFFLSFFCSALNSVSPSNAPIAFRRTSRSLAPRRSASHLRTCVSSSNPAAQMTLVPASPTQLELRNNMYLLSPPPPPFFHLPGLERCVCTYMDGQGQGSMPHKIPEQCRKPMWLNL